MARGRQAENKADDKVETVTLVSPDGEQTREVVAGSEGEVKARWDGYLPEDQQKLEAPEVPAGNSEGTVGTNA